VFGGDQASWALIAALLGGTLAATSHLAKASTRAAVNTSPEPFSNIGLSLLGDAAVPAMLWLAWEHPLWFFAALAVTVALMLALIVMLAKFLRRLLARWRQRENQLEGVSQRRAG
jgi:membrane protein YdbS with pleckstrin-like domain